jgi:hypothetical protein
MMADSITDQLRHLEDLAAMCEPGFGMGSEPFRLAREEIERLRGELSKIALRLELTADEMQAIAQRALAASHVKR